MNDYNNGYTSPGNKPEKMYTDDNGKTMAVSDWCRIYGLKKTTMMNRIYMAQKHPERWPSDRVLSTEDFNKKRNRD